MKLAVATHRNMNSAHGRAASHAGKKLARHFRQQRASQNVIDVARAALDLFAAVRNLVDNGVIVAEFGAVIFVQANLDAAQLQFDNLAHYVVGNRIVGQCGRAKQA